MWLCAHDCLDSHHKPQLHVGAHFSHQGENPITSGPKMSNGDSDMYTYRVPGWQLAFSAATATWQRILKLMTSTFSTEGNFCASDS